MRQVLYGSPHGAKMSLELQDTASCALPNTWQVVQVVMLTEVMAAAIVVGSCFAAGATAEAGTIFYAQRDRTWTADIQIGRKEDQLKKKTNDLENACSRLQNQVTRKS